MRNKTRLLTPGPTPIPDRIRLVMAQEMLHHRKHEFKSIMQRLQPKLQSLFGTKEPVLPLSTSGTGAMTAAIHGLFKTHEKLLVINAGKFGERWGHIAQCHGCETHILNIEWGQAASPETIRTILDADPTISGVLIQLSETSTGVLHPIKDIAAITRDKENVLLIVDGISSVGISPSPMDAWGIDCLLTGSQKGLMVPPGLSLIALSARAWKKAETIPQTCFYFNLLKEKASIQKHQTLFTSPISLLIGLDESLTMMLETGLEQLYRKQWALTSMTRHGAKAIGLEPLVQENFAWGVTSIRLPEGIDGTKILKIMAEEYGVIMAGGQDHLKGRIIRLGHMGWIDWADVAAGLHALTKALQDVGGYTASRNYLEQALIAYDTALQENTTKKGA